MMEENELWFWLLSLERLGPVSHRRLFEYHGDIREIWRAKNPPLTEKRKGVSFLDSRQEDRIRRSFHEMRRAGIRMGTCCRTGLPQASPRNLRCALRSFRKRRTSETRTLLR